MNYLTNNVEDEMTYSNDLEITTETQRTRSRCSLLAAPSDRLCLGVFWGGVDDRILVRASACVRSPVWHAIV